MYSNLNWIAIIVAAIVNMAIGAFWYSPAGFGKPWMKMMGFTKEDMEKGKKKMPMMYLGMFVGALVMSYILAIFVVSLNANSLAGGAIIGFLLWLGFIAIVNLNGVIFEKRPMALYKINVGYYLAVLLINGALLAMWR